MTNQYHIDFIKSFLSALGFTRIEIGVIRNNALYGKVYYTKNQHETIRWNFEKYKVSGHVPGKIADLLAKNDVLEIDRIKVSRKQLYQLYSKRYNDKISYDNFVLNLEMVEKIEVDRTNNGKVCDRFFIHE
jgi:hypothetical protein